MQQRMLTGIVLLVLFLVLAFFTSWGLPALFTACATYIVCYEWPAFIKQWLWWKYFFTIVYPIVPLCALIALSENYKALTIIICILTAVHDSASYFGGKKWGKHFISARISPGKTWEGFFAGCIATALAACILNAYKIEPISYFIVLFLSLVLSILATAGDLFESYLKRCAQLKDSGTLLPGHGGILDRIDAVLFVAVAAYLFRNYLMTIIS